MATSPTAKSNLLTVAEPKRYGSTLSLEEKIQKSFFLFYYYRMEDEAVLDRGASFIKHHCDEEEVEGKLNLSSVVFTVAAMFFFPYQCLFIYACPFFSQLPLKPLSQVG